MKTLSSCLQKLVCNALSLCDVIYMIQLGKNHSILYKEHDIILKLLLCIFSMLLRNDFWQKYINVKTVHCPQYSSSNSSWLKAAMRYRVMVNWNAFYITNTAMPLALHEMFTLLNVCFVHKNEKKIELGV